MSAPSRSPFLLPFPQRKAGVIEKLNYAEAQRKLLDKAIFDSYKVEGELPRFVSQTAETILANARECFDHLGQDLIEGHLLSFAKRSFRDSYVNGKSRHYFPFYSTQLSNQKWAFAQFKTVNRAIFDELLAFTTAVENNQFLINTSHEAKKFRVIQEMVNEKKHSRVLAYEAAEGEKIFVEGANGSFLFDKGFRNNNPNMQMVLPDGFKPRKVAAYRFACNGLDVSHLCLFASHATAMIMDVFYNRFFQATEPVFKPEPPPVITVVPAPLSEILAPNPDKHVINLPLGDDA